jgi:hypothetical protein
MATYNKHEIMNILETYHNTVSDDTFSRAETEEFLLEYLDDLDRQISKSYEIDFDFDDL